MSFEGYYRILCENGHLSGRDCYDYGDYYGDDGEECWKCPTCGAKEAWRQLIDETNGNGNDQKWPLTILEEARYDQCDLGCTHCVKEAVYKIPNTKAYEYTLSEYDIEQILIEWYETKFAVNQRVLSLELEYTGPAHDGIVARFKTMPKVAEENHD